MGYLLFEDSLDRICDGSDNLRPSRKTYVQLGSLSLRVCEQAGEGDEGTNASSEAFGPWRSQSSQWSI